jgi:hypothetical protein
MMMLSDGMATQCVCVVRIEWKGCFRGGAYILLGRAVALDSVGNGHVKGHQVAPLKVVQHLCMQGALASDKTAGACG